MRQETKAFGSFTVALLLGNLALFALIATGLVNATFPYLTVAALASTAMGGILWAMSHDHAGAAFLATAFNCTALIAADMHGPGLGIVACIVLGIAAVTTSYRASSSIGGGLAWMLASVAFEAMTVFYFNEFHDPSVAIVGIVAPIAAFGLYVRDQHDPLMHTPPPT